MWRVITFPFRQLGGLTVLAVAYLLFALGCILLIAFLTSKPPVRHLEITAEVVRVREFCYAVKRGEHNEFGVGVGFCDELEQKLTSDPKRFDGASLRRKPYFYLRYRDEAGREQARDGHATAFDLPADVQVGDRIPLKVQTKDRNWRQWRSDWYDSLPWLGIMIGSFLASTVLWTWGGGWRLMTRMNDRKNRAIVAKFNLVVIVIGFAAWVLNRIWRHVENTRFGKAVKRALRDGARV